MTRVQGALLILCLTASAVSPGGAQQQTPARAAGTVQATATAILVDVVVRDRRGQPVTDLAIGDFEVYEDDVLQDIGAMTLYAPDGVKRPPSTAQPAPAAPATPAAAKPAEPEATPEPVVALVFDRLNPEAQVFAHKAALGYIAQSGQAQSLIAVFGIDLSLRTYQTYTRDSTRLRKAVDEVGVRATGQFESQAGKARDLAQVAAGGGGTAALAAGGQAAAQAVQGGAGPGAADAIAADMQRRTIETFEMLERDQQGISTSNALLAVVNGMRAMPGRKSLIFFSEGVEIPANVAARFRSVIDTANRANVSIYAMDAAGLRTESTSKETRDSINAAAQGMLRRNPTTDVKGAPMTEALERNEYNLRRDPHSGLGQLADETGGILIRNTNDLTGGFKRIDQDMRNYYLLSYVPKNDKFDGKFRTIAVKVKRSGGVDVAARKGYYAVPSTGTMPVLSFEATPLVLLETTPVPNAFPVRVAALKFPEPGRLGLTPIMVAVPAANLTFQQADDKTSYKADFTILVRFKNAEKVVVDKMSQNYVLAGPMDKLESVKQGNILFYREPELMPGVYSMEAIVYDALAERASVRFTTVEQSKSDESTLRASNLVLVGSAERVAQTARPEGNPFLVGEMLLYPNMGEAVRKSATPEIGFFFTVYPAKGSKPDAILEVMQSGAALAKLPLPLGEPDSAGRIQQVSRLPTAALSPGTYDLRLVITQGQQQISRSAIVRIVD